MHDERASAGSKRRAPRRVWAVLTALCAAVVLASCVAPPEDPGGTTTTEPGSTTTTELGSTTTEPGSTTTEPGSTTTTEATTSTVPSTTTTVPDPEPEAVYDFGSDASMLTEPGQSVDVVVGGVAPDGQGTDEPAPEGTTYDVIGDTGAFDVTDLEHGGLRVTSTGQVGGIVVAARVPGQDLAVATEIFSAVPAAGVQVVPDTEVVYPVPNLSKHADPTEVRKLSPDGEGQVAAFVPYGTVGGVPGADPEVVDIELYGSEGSRTLSIPLDRGAAVYRESYALELATETREIVIDAPDWDGGLVELTPYRLPGLGAATLVDRDATIVREVEGCEWNGWQATLSVDLPYDATHVGVRLPSLDAQRIVEVVPDGTTLAELRTGGDELVVRGTASVQPGFGCGAYVGRPAPFRIRVVGVTEGDASGWTSGYSVDEDQWVVPAADGSFTWRTWTNGPPTVGAHVEVSFEAQGLLGSAWWNSTFIPLEQFQDGEIDLEVHCNVW